MALANTPSVRPQTSVHEALAIDAAAPPLASGIVKDPSKIWILFYRHGVNPSCYKGFYHDGTMREAQNRAQKHCNVMGYRYIYIRPFMVDIDKEEADRAAALSPAATA